VVRVSADSDGSVVVDADRGPAAELAQAVAATLTSAIPYTGNGGVLEADIQQEYRCVDGSLTVTSATIRFRRS